MCNDPNHAGLEAEVGRLRNYVEAYHTVMLRVRKVEAARDHLVEKLEDQRRIQNALRAPTEKQSVAWGRWREMSDDDRFWRMERYRAMASAAEAERDRYRAALEHAQTEVGRLRALDEWVKRHG